MHKRGFTLIELLVVISIIGLLSSVVLASLNSARAKARDAVRKETMKQLQSALALYYHDNGEYPHDGWWSSESGDAVWSGPANNGDWIPGLVAGKYIGAMPKDPKGGYAPGNAAWKSAYLYLSYAPYKHYKILAHTSPETGYVVTDPFYDKLRPGWAWMVTDKIDMPPAGGCYYNNDTSQGPTLQWSNPAAPNYGYDYPACW